MTREEFAELISDMTDEELRMVYEVLLSLQSEHEDNQLPHPLDPQIELRQTNA